MHHLYIQCFASPEGASLLIVRIWTFRYWQKSCECST